MPCCASIKLPQSDSHNFVTFLSYLLTNTQPHLYIHERTSIGRPSFCSARHICTISSTQDLRASVLAALTLICQQLGHLDWYGFRICLLRPSCIGQARKLGTPFPPFKFMDTLNPRACLGVPPVVSQTTLFAFLTQSCS